MRGRDQRAYDRFERAVELPMLVLSLIFVVILLIPWMFDVSHTAEMAFEAAAWLIWAAFAAEYMVKLYLAADRWHMVRTHILDLLIILLPFLRPLRAFRALRLLRGGAALARGVQSWQRMFGRRGFKAFLGVVLLIVVGSGVTVWLLERQADDPQITNPIDGIWWALVTSTTVGYGDLVPVSDAGRGFAVLLMLVGIALLSVVTAQIAAFFVESDDQQPDGPSLAELDERLARIERLLEAQSDITPEETEREDKQ